MIGGGMSAEWGYMGWPNPSMFTVLTGWSVCVAVSA